MLKRRYTVRINLRFYSRNHHWGNLSGGVLAREVFIWEVSAGDLCPGELSWAFVLILLDI